MTAASTEKEEAPKTEKVDVQGRAVEIRELNDAQIALMARNVRIIGRDSVDGARKMDAVAQMLEILQSVVVKPADKEYMEDLIVAGSIDLKKLTSFVTVFQNEQAAPAQPKVRRGRPPLKRA